MYLDWEVLPLNAAICARARQPFSAEPIRTLDALHLASDVALWAAEPDTELLSLDQRIRKVGRELGFTLAPLA